MTPDMLTWLGLLGGVITCVGYALAAISPMFYGLALFGLVLNWLGDSLDGSIARHRGIERPQYGFFLDHTVDGFAMALIAGGVGLSPLAHLWCALVGLVGYYILTIVSLMTCLATGVFKVSFAGFGPTEIRLAIAGATICGAVLPGGEVNVAGWSITICDGGILALAAGLVVTAVIQTVATARKLALIDPPHRVQ
jgi:phosphatidylglycerophosphate synthase